MRNRSILFIILLSMLAGCSYVGAPNGGDETGGLIDGPPEVADPPQWVCKERAPDITLPDDDESLPEQETCTFTPAIPHHGWSGKPYWRGIPEFFGNVPRELGDFPYLAHGGADSIEGSIADPVYSWLMTEDMSLYYELQVESPEHPTLPSSLDDFRSGLIGNFALWVGGVPEDHPRPPIVTASLLGVFNDNLTTIIGHPFYSGRYNAYGMPCSTAPSSTSSFEPIDWGFEGSINGLSVTNNAECVGYIHAYGTVVASPVYPLGLGPYASDFEAANEAACLSNGGVYQLPAALTTAEFRNGLVWVNWGADYVEEFKAWVIVNVPQLEPLLVALDALEFTGWDIWPLNPDYPYNIWSHTGVCAYAASIGLVNDIPSTILACPLGYRAVLPDFDLPLDETVEGYCTIPHIVPPPDGLADATPLGEVLVGKPGQGFLGARYVSLSALSEARLNAWATGVSVTATVNGYQVSPATSLGRDILAAFDVPEGSVILAVNDLLLAEDSAGDQPTLMDVLAEIDLAIRQGNFVMMVADSPDGRRLHRYVVFH